MSIKNAIKHLEACNDELESRNDDLEKSTQEKEEILAGVISDLETKNRHLHDAMGHITSEYQVRSTTTAETLYLSGQWLTCWIMLFIKVKLVYFIIK